MPDVARAYEIGEGEGGKGRFYGVEELERGAAGDGMRVGGVDVEGIGNHDLGGAGKYAPGKHFVAADAGIGHAEALKCIGVETAAYGSHSAVAPSAESGGEGLGTGEARGGREFVGEYGCAVGSDEPGKGGIDGKRGKRGIGGGIGIIGGIRRKRRCGGRRGGIIGGSSGEGAGEFEEVGGLDGVVGVKLYDEFSGGILEGSKARTEGTAGVFLERKDTDTFISFGTAVGYIEGGVGRGIIDDDHFPVGKGLRLDGTDGLGDVCRGIIHG